MNLKEMLAVCGRNNISANEPMLKEVAVLMHKIMNEAIQFDNRKMFEQSGEPAISFKHLLPAVWIIKR